MNKTHAGSDGNKLDQWPQCRSYLLFVLTGDDFAPLALDAMVLAGVDRPRVDLVVVGTR